MQNIYLSLGIIAQYLLAPAAGHPTAASPQPTVDASVDVAKVFPEPSEFLAEEANFTLAVYRDQAVLAKRRMMTANERIFDYGDKSYDPPTQVHVPLDALQREWWYAGGPRFLDTFEEKFADSAVVKEKGLRGALETCEIKEDEEEEDGRKSADCARINRFFRDERDGSDDGQKKIDPAVNLALARLSLERFEGMMKDVETNLAGAFSDAANSLLKTPHITAWWKTLPDYDRREHVRNALGDLVNSVLTIGISQRPTEKFVHYANAVLQLEREGKLPTPGQIGFILDWPQLLHESNEVLGEDDFNDAQDRAKEASAYFAKTVADAAGFAVTDEMRHNMADDVTLRNFFAEAARGGVTALRAVSEKLVRSNTHLAASLFTSGGILTDRPDAPDAKHPMRELLAGRIAHYTLNKAITAPRKHKALYITCTPEFTRSDPKNNDKRWQPASSCSADTSGDQDVKLCHTNGTLTEACYLWAYSHTNCGAPTASHNIDPPDAWTWGLAAPGATAPNVINAAVTAYETNSIGFTADSPQSWAQLTEPRPYDIPVCFTARNPNTDPRVMVLRNRNIPATCGPWGRDTPTFWAASNLPLPADAMWVRDGVAEILQRTHKDRELEAFVAHCRLGVQTGPWPFWSNHGLLQPGRHKDCDAVIEMVELSGARNQEELGGEAEAAARCRVGRFWEGKFDGSCKPYRKVWERWVNEWKDRGCKKYAKVGGVGVGDYGEKGPGGEKRTVWETLRRGYGWGDAPLDGVKY